MTKIEPAKAATVDHSGRWVLLSGVGFLLVAGGLMLALRWLGLK